ncbi:MAG: MSMEG_4193 family putative phosphomutase [Ilumatobacteraceae bacterium]|jgi:probable phosphoglycerate mutase
MASTVGSEIEMARTKQAPPAATTVLLVRHGQTPTTGKILPGRAPGLHLADVGRQQAERAAERIAELKKVDAVYASPLERARETAAPIAAARGLRVQTYKGLLEADFGEWTGAELKSLMKLPEWTTVQRAPSTFTFPGGESFSAMQARMVAALDELRSRHPGGTIVCVSHADPIKAAVAHAMGTHLDLFQRIVISTCSVSAIAYTAGGPVVLTVNSTGGSLTGLVMS